MKQLQLRFIPPANAALVDLTVHSEFLVQPNIPNLRFTKHPLYEGEGQGQYGQKYPEHFLVRFFSKQDRDSDRREGEEKFQTFEEDPGSENWETETIHATSKKHVFRIPRSPFDDRFTIYHEPSIHDFTFTLLDRLSMGDSRAGHKLYMDEVSPRFDQPSPE